MNTDPAQQAINEALQGNWQKALDLNKKILKDDPKDIEALNRLAKAYVELGQVASAQKTAQSVLKIDPFNSIAEKCLDKWKGLKKVEKHKPCSATGGSFIEEPGKTKIVSLLNLGSDKVLAKLDSGDEVKLNPHGHRISALTLEGKYVGRLPDDIGSRIKRLLLLGKEYSTLIKSVDKKEVRVFIREIKSSGNAIRLTSFSTEKIEYISFTPPELVHKKEEMIATPSDEDSE